MKHSLGNDYQWHHLVRRDGPRPEDLPRQSRRQWELLRQPRRQSDAQNPPEDAQVARSISPNNTASWTTFRKFPTLHPSSMPLPGVVGAGTSRCCIPGLESTLGTADRKTHVARRGDIHVQEVVNGAAIGRVGKTTTVGLAILEPSADGARDEVFLCDAAKVRSVQ